MRQSQMIAVMATSVALLTAAVAQPTIISSPRFAIGNGDSYVVTLSEDGNKLLVHSWANNLVPYDYGNTTTYPDLYLVRLDQGMIERVTIPPGGGEPNDGISGPVLYLPPYADMSDDGRYIVYQSKATNLDPNVPADARYSKIYLRYPNGVWRCISRDGDMVSGGHSPSISADGKYVLFTRVLPTNGRLDAMLYDVFQNTYRILLGEGHVFEESIGREKFLNMMTLGISKDGRRALVWVSSATARLDRLVWIDIERGEIKVVARAPQNPQQLFFLSRFATRDGEQISVVLGTDESTASIQLVKRIPLLGTRFLPYHTISGPSVPGQVIGGYYYYPKGRRISENSTTFFLVRRNLDTCAEEIISYDYWGSPRDWGVRPLLDGSAHFVSGSGKRYAYGVFERRYDNRNLPWGPNDTNGYWDVFVGDIDRRSATPVTVGAPLLGNGPSNVGSVSGEVWLDRFGRVAAFTSTATNLVPGDTNNSMDIFIYIPNSPLRRIMGINGVQPNGHSFMPRVSRDGRWVAFTSAASNLVTGDTNGKYDVFLCDLQTGQIIWVSRNGNGHSHSPSISGDGRYVAFISEATNLIPGDSDTNNAADVFVYDRITNTMRRLRPASGEANGSALSVSLSANGRFVAFESVATNWVADDRNNVADIFVYDLLNNTVVRITARGVELNGASEDPSISDDGRFVAFVSRATNAVAQDRDTIPDVYVADLANWGNITLDLVSVSSSGVKANGACDSPSISGDGRYVAFSSSAVNLAPGLRSPTERVYVFDRTRRWLLPIPARCWDSHLPAARPNLSGNGQVIGLETNSPMFGLPMGADTQAVILPVECVPPGDTNYDGVVDDADLLMVLIHFGSGGLNLCADLDGDGIVSDSDLLIVLFNFGRSCGFGMASDWESEAPEEPVSSLERQAAELDLAHQGLWPYPVVGRGSAPWVQMYGDPLQMSRAELERMVRDWNAPEGRFAPLSGNCGNDGTGGGGGGGTGTGEGGISQCLWGARNGKDVRIGGSDINVKVEGSYDICITCTGAKAEARAQAVVNFFSLNYTVAEAYALAQALNTRGDAWAYLKFFGNTVWQEGPHSQSLTYTYASQCRYNGNRRNIGPVTDRKSAQMTFTIGPVPVRVELGYNAEVGACYKLYGQLAPVIAEARFSPYARVNAFGSASVSLNLGIGRASAGIQANLTLLDYTMEAYGYAALEQGQGRQCCLNYDIGIYNEIRALQGNLEVYAEACAFRKCKRWSKNLFSWSGIRNQGYLLRFTDRPCF